MDMYRSDTGNEPESPIRMIILAVLVVFLFAKAAIALVRQAPDTARFAKPARARPRRSSGRPDAVAPAIELAPHEERWTALDEVQLNRLLKDASS